MTGPAPEKKGPGRPRESAGGQGNPRVSTRVPEDTAAFVASQPDGWLKEVVIREHLASMRQVAEDAVGSAVRKHLEDAARCLRLAEAAAADYPEQAKGLIFRAAREVEELPDLVDYFTQGSKPDGVARTR